MRSNECCYSVPPPRSVHLGRYVRALLNGDYLQLHVFLFDETHSTLQGWGSAVNLAPWYASQSVSICHACFVCGSEEILLIDNGCQARIFSLITQQFRYGLHFELLRMHTNICPWTGLLPCRWAVFRELSILLPMAHVCYWPTRARNKPLCRPTIGTVLDRATR